METSVSMKTTAQNGTKNTTTLSYVNPNASNQLLKTYAEKLASLTSDTYSGATKIEKTNLDEEQTTKLPRNPYMVYEGTTPNPTVTSIFAGTVPACGEEGFVSETTAWAVHYQGTLLETVAVFADSGTKEAFFDLGMSPPVPITVQGGGGAMEFGLAKVGDGTLELEEGKTATFTIHADATDIYEALDFVVSIQGGNG